MDRKIQKKKKKKKILFCGRSRTGVHPTYKQLIAPTTPADRQHTSRNFESYSRRAGTRVLNEVCCQGQCQCAHSSFAGTRRFGAESFVTHVDRVPISPSTVTHNSLMQL